QQQIHRVDVADLLDQLDRRAAEGIDRPAHLGQTESRVGDGGPDVGREQQLDTAAGAIAVDGRDDGLRVRVALQERVADGAGCLGTGRQVAADVRAGAEG